MTIHVDWADADRNCIHLKFTPGWTWDELRQAVQQADSLMASVGHTVHVMIDIRANGGLPGDFLNATRDILAQGEARPNEGQRVVIGAGMVMRAAYRSLLAVYGPQLATRPFLFASSPEDAQKLLETAP
jgi:hypothetical protein